MTTSYAPGNVHPKWSHEWIDEEAEFIIARGYARHHSLGDESTNEPRPLTEEEMNRMAEPRSYPVKTVKDRVAKLMVDALVPFTHWFFKDKYNHHAVVLETVAAVPGMVGGVFRHLKSLRTMSRDYGWIQPLWEEAENERMHLLMWMQVTEPTKAERSLVVLAQAGYSMAYALMYLLSPATAHRFVGYLEERAVDAYTGYLGAVDSGHIKNTPAPALGIRYYNLAQDATLRDVILQVRVDECMHRNMNHLFSEMYTSGRKNEKPEFPPKREALLH